MLEPSASPCFEVYKSGKHQRTHALSGDKSSWIIGQMPKCLFNRFWVFTAAPNAHMASGREGHGDTISFLQLQCPRSWSSWSGYCYQQPTHLQKTRALNLVWTCNFQKAHFLLFSKMDVLRSATCARIALDWRKVKGLRPKRDMAEKLLLWGRGDCPGPVAVLKRPGLNVWHCSWAWDWLLWFGSFGFFRFQVPRPFLRPWTKRSWKQSLLWN